MAHEAPTGPGPPASRAFDAAIEAADAGTLAAATVAGLAAELCQIQASQPVAKHGRAEAELAGRCRPLAEEAAKALAVVSSARGELEAAASAAAARVGELQSALDARGAEERRTREHAAAVHTQRVALMGQLEAERERRAAAEQASGAAEAEAEALKQELSVVRCELEEAQSSLGLLSAGRRPAGSVASPAPSLADSQGSRDEDPAAREKALRFLGRELLLLRDAHAREEAAAAAAASDNAALRADLEAARNESVEARSKAHRLGQQLNEARAVQQAIGGAHAGSYNDAASVRNLSSLRGFSTAPSEHDSPPPGGGMLRVSGAAELAVRRR